MKITVEQAMQFMDDFFSENERIAYNILYIIAASRGKFFAASDGTFLIAQADTNYPLWIWTANGISDSSFREVLRILNEKQEINPSLKINTASEKVIANFNNKRTETMNVYSYPEISAVPIAKGELIKAEMNNIDEAAKMVADMELEAGNMQMKFEKATFIAESLIKSEDLFLWRCNGKIVSMAAIIHKTDKYARIGRVFTPKESRCNGYCSAMMGTLAQDVCIGGGTPMLYTQADNRASNRAYKRAGFYLCGSIKQIFCDSLLE